VVVFVVTTRASPSFSKNRLALYWNFWLFVDNLVISKRVSIFQKLITQILSPTSTK
jgi:hypothetical protein